MHEFLLGLLADLDRHCAVLLERVAAAQEIPDLADTALDAYTQVEGVRRDCQALRQSPNLGAPSLLPNHFRSFNLWSQNVTLIEYYLLPCLERFDIPDRRLTHLCRALVAEAAWPLDPPLIAAFSSEYFWTLPAFNTVWVPATEDARLLGLPDLVHELTHPLYRREPAALVADFPDLVTANVRTQWQQAVANQSPMEVAFFQVLLRQWIGSWLEEFVCDMAAAYVLGSPYGYQHIRLCTWNNSDIYHPGLGQEAIHPSDEARLRAISTILRLLDGDDEADRLEDQWTEYAALRSVRPPAGYELCYPQSLLNALSERVVAGCRALGIRTYDQSGGDRPVSVRLIIRTAWEQFLTNPEGYGEWEAIHVEDLWQAFGA